MYTHIGLRLPLLADKSEDAQYTQETYVETYVEHSFNIFWQRYIFFVKRLPQSALP
jgi:hypothetical protein